MFNSVVLNVVIGLVFIYLLYSLLATIIQEIIATYIGLRARTLRKGISRMLDDDVDNKTLSTAFYDHPLIKYLGENKFHSKPAYMTAQNFSKVFIDLLRGDNVLPGQSYNSLIHQALVAEKTLWGEGVEISPQTLTYIKSLWADAQGDVEKFSGFLEQWFNDTMERASGWFKKKTQLILFFIGLALAISFNIDTISIGGILSNDPKLAAQLADNASVYVQNHKEIGSQTQMEQGVAADKTMILNIDNQFKTTINKSDSLMNTANALIRGDIADTNKLLGLGWSGSVNFHWWSIIGWIITALAISLGAPFWFDLLNKLMQLRSSKKQDSDSSIKTSDKTIPTTVNINTQTSEEAVG